MSRIVNLYGCCLNTSRPTSSHGCRFDTSRLMLPHGCHFDTSKHSSSYKCHFALDMSRLSSSYERCLKRASLLNGPDRSRQSSNTEAWITFSCLCCFEMNSPSCHQYQAPVSIHSCSKKKICGTVRAQTLR